MADSLLKVERHPVVGTTLTMKGIFWRDDPSRFPRTTWHASDWRAGDIQGGQWIALCGFATGQRRTSIISLEVACPECVQLVEHHAHMYFCRRCLGTISPEHACYNDETERICTACWDKGERPASGIAVFTLPGA